MDPITAVGLAASIAQLIDVTLKTIGFLKDVKDAPKDRAYMEEEAISLLTLLTKLKNKVEEPATKETWFTGIRALGVVNGPLDQLKVALEKLVKKLKPQSGFKRVLTWTLDKHECFEILNKIERVKSHIGLALQEDTLELAQAIKAETSELPSLAAKMSENTAEVKHLKSSEDNRLRQTVIDRLSPLNFFTTQQDTYERRQPGTGQWLLESPQFKQWLSGSCDTLWCPGIPGAGKTILASIVVDHLRKQFKSSDDIGVASIYCNYKERDKQTHINFLASLWRQLVQDDIPLAKQVMDLYNLHHIKRTSPSFREILSILQTEISRHSTVFIVMDALDECTDHSRVSLLAELKSRQPTIRLMVTSRCLDNITREFNGITPLEIGARDEDLKAYLLGRLSGEDRLARLVSKDIYLENEILEAISTKAEKMFLLAQLHMDSLATKTTPKAVRKALSLLPKELDSTYEDAMHRIESQNEDDKILAEQVLYWIVHAFRPLTVVELQHALAVELDEPEFDKSNIADQELLTSVCAGLVVIDEQSHLVRLVHYTTQEYFDRIASERFPDSHTKILQTCLTYLSYHCTLGPLFLKDEGDDEEEDEAENEPENQNFLSYTYAHWGVHARKVPKKALDDLVLPFLRKGPKILGYSYLLETGNPFSRSVSASGLHIAAAFGLVEVMSVLLETTENINQTDRDGLTALHWAATNNQSLALRLLLEHEADIGIKSNSMTALEVAALRHWDAAVQVLLEHRVNFEVKNIGELCTVVVKPYSESNIAILQSLLEHGANVNLRTRRGDALLHLAVWPRNDTVVQVLLKYGADPNAKDFDGRTPLEIASLLQYSIIMEMLLKHGADVNIKNNDGGTPLYTAIFSGHHIMDMLLKHGADINTKDNHGLTPLCGAIFDDNVNIIERLLKHGVDVNIKNNFGETPLYAVIFMKNRTIMEILLKHGADVNIRSDRGETPLQYAERRGSDPTIQLLLKNNTDVNIAAAIEDTVLHTAAE